MKLPNPHHRALHLSRSAHNAISAAVEHGNIAVSAATRSLMVHTPRDDSPGSTCEPGNDSPICQKPAIQPTTATLPIVLGAVIPIVCAIVVFIFLHRRHLKKQRIEDANDPHKSLDFGLGGVGGSGRINKRGIPEMKVTDIGLEDPLRPGHKIRGFSMDMGSPYILPAGLNGSHESIRSMSRSMTQDEYDPYRPVGFIRGSVDSNRPRFNDNGSVYSQSTLQASDKANLVRNASPMSQTFPKRGDSAAPTPVDSKAPTLVASSPQSHPSLEEQISGESGPLPPAKASLAVPEHARGQVAEIVDADLPLPELPSHDDHKSLPPPPPEPEEQEYAPPPRVRSFSQPLRPPRKDSAPARQPSTRESSNYGDDIPQIVVPPIPTVNEPEPEYEEDDHYDIDPSMIETGRFSVDDPNYLGHDIVADYEPGNRLSVAGVRPLPPQHLLQEDNPEQRANRIRSFYKEYFDDSGNKDRNTAYFDDGVYGDDFDGAIYDPETGAFYMPNKPFAQNPGRRAMTPPPRGAGGPRGGPFPGDDVHRRQFSTMSGGFRGRPPPQKKKNLPPPKALQGLPTPAKLGYDTALINPIDFAPPTSFRELQNGRRPDSPLGQQRPFSPAVRPFTPLASSFADLSPMPSPHLLRKSGTFTALDFAPPRLTIRDGHGSDAGSIRSARSGISAMQMDAVRAGAYRVSRIPKEMVTTRDDFSVQLRPKLNMVNPA